MTAPGSSWPLARRAIRAGRALLLVVAVVASVPVWLAWVLIVALLSMARPFVTVPLGLLAITGFALALYFLTQGDGSGAARAALMGGLCGAGCLAFTALGDRIGPSGPVWPMPPWWWYS
ncbi:Hypothetical protein RMHFA_05586 (plasmid) [Roseomonas mucosa]|nr:Hypothetical protein RMHFA_05586 [Roseomonas mucosa]